MKIYFDQNSWQEIFKRYTTDKFKSKIKLKNIEIYFGLETIYEFGRLFLDDKQQGAGEQVFSYINELTEIITYLKEPGNLIIDDLDYALYGGKLLPALDQYNTAATKQEIFKASQGKFGEGKKFIAQRENDIEKISLRFSKTIISTNPKLKQNICFEKFRDHFLIRRNMLNSSSYSKKTKYLSNEKLFNCPAKYPYINTWINAQLYIAFSTLSRNAKAKNYTSDFRHLICANAAGNLVTIDSRLIKIGRKVCPFINILRWEEFQKILEN